MNERTNETIQDSNIDYSSGIWGIKRSPHDEYYLEFSTTWLYQARQISHFVWGRNVREKWGGVVWNWEQEETMERRNRPCDMITFWIRLAHFLHWSFYITIGDLHFHAQMNNRLKDPNFLSFVSRFRLKESRKVSLLSVQKSKVLRGDRKKIVKAVLQISVRDNGY